MGRGQNLTPGFLGDHPEGCLVSCGGKPMPVPWGSAESDMNSVRAGKPKVEAESPHST